MRGYDDDVAKESALSLMPITRCSTTAIVKCLSEAKTPEVISRITTLLVGLQWRKEDKANITLEKKSFLLEG